MSNYENYDNISKTYDKTRTAVGIEVILGVLFNGGKNLDELTVLDAGCGTGNYAQVLDAKVGRLICADFSAGMLSKAIEKIAPEEELNSQFVQCDLGELPFAEQSFDAIICNQCLHHLDTPGTNFKNQRSFFKKALSVLKDDGVIIVNTITHRQMRDGVWWAELIKPAVEKMTPRFTSDNEFEALLDETGFYIEHRIVPVSEIIQKENYFDHNSIRDEEFRNGDSHFTLLTDDELRHTLDSLDKMEKEGTIAEYLKKRDELRLQVGQFTVFAIRKK